MHEMIEGRSENGNPVMRCMRCRAIFESLPRDPKDTMPQLYAVFGHLMPYQSWSGICPECEAAQSGRETTHHTITKSEGGS